MEGEIARNQVIYTAYGMFPPDTHQKLLGSRNELSRWPFRTAPTGKHPRSLFYVVWTPRGQLSRTPPGRMCGLDTGHFRYPDRSSTTRRRTATVGTALLPKVKSCAAIVN